MDKIKSPFKFLDSYDEKDVDIWFGREQETTDLYEALSGVKHLLVYGPSGAGKTSLIECGLKNSFSDADWYTVSIRRGNNLIQSTNQALNSLLDNPFEIDSTTQQVTEDGTEVSFGQLVRRIYNENYQPVFLLFDQFEELLISGHKDEDPKKDERIEFFRRFEELINYRVPCRAILIMREEFVGNLSEFEHICPSIFQHRFRLEKMRRKNVQSMILNTLTAEHFESYFQVEDPHQLTEAILGKIPDSRQEIELAHVQVFFDELWERANTENPDSPTLRTSLIQEKDNLESILDNFLQNQRKELEPRYGKESLLEVLTQMISERDTKLQVSQADIEQGLKKEGVVLRGSLHEILLQGKERRMIRTLKVGDEARYEISHDLLAKVVGQNRTNEMELRKRATEVYKVYLGQIGLFSQENLNFILPFNTVKPIPAALRARIEESQTAIDEAGKAALEKSQARVQRLGAIAGVAVICFIAAVFFGIKSNAASIKADNERINAENLANNLQVQKDSVQEVLSELVKAEIERKKRRFNELERLSKVILNKDNLEGCPLDYLNEMRAIAQDPDIGEKEMMLKQIAAIQRLNPNCQ